MNAIHDFKKSEAQEQIALIEYCKYRNIAIFAIPNGGSRNALEARNLKRQGVMAGVPDLFVPIANKIYYGLFIEMKVKPNKPTEKQLEWIERLICNGYKAVVCYGFDEARKVLENYLKMR